MTDCDVHDCLLTPLPEENLVAPPDHLLDDVPWSDLSLPGEQETDDCSLDDEEFALPPLRADDWDRILASVEQEEDIEEVIEAMGAPAPAPAPAALGLGWLFSGSTDTAAFTWRSFCGWPVGVVQDTDDTLHILLCVREQLGLPPLDSMRLLTAPLHESPAVRPSWDRYLSKQCGADDVMQHAMFGDAWSDTDEAAYLDLLGDQYALARWQRLRRWSPFASTLLPDAGEDHLPGYTHAPAHHILQVDNTTDHPITLTLSAPYGLNVYWAHSKKERKT